jgi:NADH-quinone oxidoreductase subunit J
MSITHWVFWVFSVLLVSFSMLSVMAKNTVHAVMSLIFVFFCSSVLWLILQAEFLGLVLLFVYVGAVMTLFLFVVMMLNLSPQPGRKWLRYLPLASVVLVLIIGLMALSLSHMQLSFAQPMMHHPASYNNTAALGAVLYTHYIYPFQLTGILLLTAIIAAVALVHRRVQRAKYQDISAQIKVDPKSRIHLINMASESK